jgi:threonine aldolase
MRQTGVLAASAAYALSHNFPLLSRVHALAKRLEVGLEDIGASILSRAETCMVSYYFLILKSLIIDDVTVILRSFAAWGHLR